MRGADGRPFDARLPGSIRGIVWLADREFVPATVGVEPPAELLRTVRAATSARDVILVPIIAAYHGVALACEGDDLAVVRASLSQWSSDGGEDAALGEVVEHHVAPSTVAEVLDVARDEGFEGAAVREAVEWALDVALGHESHGVHAERVPQVRALECERHTAR